MSVVQPGLEQTPQGGTSIVRYRGDSLEFCLRLSRARDGTAWLRTNIGKAYIHRREVVRHVEKNQPILARDWHDHEMRRVDDRNFSITLPLVDVGVFEAKAFFLPDGENEPVWPAGRNVHVKTEPAGYRRAGTIYTAFVRQFRTEIANDAAAVTEAEALKTLEAVGYAAIPRSGTFRDLIEKLDFIVGALGCRTIQLLPIHPTPTTHARMGRFGSPFAVLDFKDVDPALAQFDRRTTPLDQFRELVDAVHERHARIFMDIPANHTGWASSLLIHHPEWFTRNEDRSFRSPGAWGVTWEDLAQLDYRHHALWSYMAGVLLLWCRLGVDGFRCDAGYMIPAPAWQYIVAEVRAEYPDTVFLLEGLGGRTSTAVRLLSRTGLNWAYSELFQHYDRDSLEAYLPGCFRTSVCHGTLVQFAETHDNDRLAGRSHCFARMRTALTALCSHGGAFGFANGVEWFAQEKIDVHGAPSLNWGNPENQVARLARLNTLLETHPCFDPDTALSLIECDGGNTLALLRTMPEGPKLLVLANLDDRQAGTVSWAANDYDPGTGLFDLLENRYVQLERDGTLYRHSLEAGEVLCLSADRTDSETAMAPAEATANHAQRLRALALEIRLFYGADEDLAEVDVEQLAAELAADPAAFCTAASGDGYARLVNWHWPGDTNRIVMLPPDHCMLITANHHFRADLTNGQTVLNHTGSLVNNAGGHFVILLPAGATNGARRLKLKLTVYQPGLPRRAEGDILQLAGDKDGVVNTSVTGNDLKDPARHALCANGRGGMSQVRCAWGTVRSQYDALLAGNLHPSVPVDRRIMLTRCRTWLVWRDYSQPLNQDCLTCFKIEPDGTVNWRFEAPVGMGKQVDIGISLKMHEGRNAVSLAFRRYDDTSAGDRIPADAPVRLILRPDIEDRGFHEKTKAWLGPQAAWPAAIEAGEEGFGFAPSPGYRLDVTVTGAQFVHEPEWTYMVQHPLEAERGLDDSSDLFSPGYFSVDLAADSEARLDAAIGGEICGVDLPVMASWHSGVAGRPLEDRLISAMRAFIVRRDSSLTIVAGYPWFLDWGRDTLICLRGVIAAGLHDEAESILCEFARMESGGTLPNMIRGNDDSNRDTSDAPLWFLVACADMVKQADTRAFLETDCGGRTIMGVVKAIANAYVNGTGNGIEMDPNSGLIFSPSHFTWMDTDHPAGTPRQGYPIEIQALWFAALSFLSQIDPTGQWSDLVARVRRSIMRYFVRPTPDPCLSDCLHATPGTPARDAIADDHVRPNQLLAITLGAIADPELCQGILRACEALLVPGAIRSLADETVQYRLPVEHNGALLNDPVRPYCGRYEGDEDTMRKPAYHNGTAWGWLFPSYSEALFQTYGEPARAAALSLLTSCTGAMYEGCLGQLPEILDGNAPHLQRGCSAQAWSVTELYRALALLRKTR